MRTQKEIEGKVHTSLGNAERREQRLWFIHTINHSVHIGKSTCGSVAVPGNSHVSSLSRDVRAEDRQGGTFQNVEDDMFMLSNMCA